MINVAEIGQHRIPLCFLTLACSDGTSNSSRQLKLKEIWGPVLGGDVSRFFFNGFDGKTLFGRKDGSWRQDTYDRLVRLQILERFSGPRLNNLQPSEIAITLGFLHMCVAMVKQRLPYVLYMEDDANLLESFSDDRLVSPNPQTPQHFRDRVASILDKLQHVSWDIVRLGGIFSSGCRNLGYVEKGLTIGKTGFCLGCHGLFLSQKTARVMLQHMFPISTTLDHALLLKARTFGLIDLEITPHIIGQDILIASSESLIGYAPYERIFLRTCLQLRISPAFFMTMIMNLNKVLNRES